MPNYLTEKQSVQNWSKIASLTLLILPKLLNKDYFWESKEWKEISETKAQIKFLVLILLFALVTYLVNYYTISSLFWPEPLGVVNHLLLVPSLVYTGVSVWEVGWGLKRLK